MHRASVTQLLSHSFYHTAYTSHLLSHILTEKDWRINSSYGIIVSKLECIHKANRNIERTGMNLNMPSHMSQKETDDRYDL